MKINISKLTTIHVDRLHTIKRSDLANYVFFVGIALAFFASLRPWFLWSIGNIYMVPAGLLIIASAVISKASEHPIFTKENVLQPIIITSILLIYDRLVSSSNLSGFIATFFNCIIFYYLFKYDKRKLMSSTKVLAEILAAFLAISIFAFILYIIGFPFPSSDLVYGDMKYSFSNYYLFLVPDQDLLSIFPRFQSVFLEPSHLGVPCVLLLQAQRGNWKKWYNIILLISTLLTFSLGAYVYLVFVLFLNSWCNRKKILAKALLTIMIIATVIGGSFIYNGGDNLIHNLIVLRLEVNDGELAGNNRTNGDFDQEFDSYIKSNDIWTGRELEDDTGNSGYKVYIYRYGIIGLVIFLVFVFITLSQGNDKRGCISAIIIALLIFLVDAFVTWYCRYIPLLCTSKRVDDIKDKEQDLKPIENENIA